MLNLKKFYKKHKTLKAMISMELLFIFCMLGFVLNSIVKFTYAWIQKFYAMHAILIMVNSYVHLPSSVEEKKFNSFSTKSEDMIVVKSVDKSLVISCNDSSTIQSIHNFLEEKIISSDYKIIAEDKTIKVQAA